jgi:hypothetical protein
MTTYNKSLSTDFNGNLNISQLLNEINESSISPTCLTVFNLNNIVAIKFNSSLSSEEQSTLNSIISSHSPNAHIGNTITNIGMSNTRIDSTTYTTLTSFDFPGLNIWSDVSNIKIISLMEAGGDSYDVRIYDVTNNNLICSKTLNNEYECISDLGSLSNLPSDESIFEIQAKINNNTIAHIKNISIYHD